jgi:hypothetical protein
MIDKFYVRYREDFPDTVNNFAAWEGFKQIGIETAPFYSFGDVETLDRLGPYAGVAGFVCDVHKALESLGLLIPDSMDYPEELRDFLGREVHLTTLGEIRRTIKPTFIKPKLLKEFTGLIWDGSRGPRLSLATCPDETEVWSSEVVNFVSEYRCFVLEGSILDVRKYKGDWSVAPDFLEVKLAVEAYCNAPVSYALDFGITSEGRTLLIEGNDGYALGHYGLPSTQYAKLLEARWEELTKPLVGV